VRIRVVILTACVLLLSSGYDSAGGAARWNPARASFYVSTEGNDLWPGTRVNAFATLGRARDAVRKLKETGQNEDVLVLIRGGTYYVPEGVTFGPEDSGTEEYKISYAAYPEEVPVFIGGVRITGLRRHKGGIYVADLAEGVKGSQLFENGRRMNLARAPNKGYFTLEKGSEVDGKMAFGYRRDDVDPAGWDVSEVTRPDGTSARGG